jgi:hypothetical protein
MDGWSPTRGRANGGAVFVSAVFVVIVAIAVGALSTGVYRHGQLVALLVAGGAALIGATTYSVKLTSVRVASSDVDVMDSLALTFCVIAVGFVTFNGVRAGAGLGIFDPFLLAAALCLIARFLAGRQLEAHLPRWAWVPGYVMLVTGLASALIVGTIGPNVTPAVRFAIAIGVTPAVIAICGRTPRRRQVLLGAWLIGACANCAVGILDFSNITSIGPSLVGGDNSGSGGRFAGLTAHPNHLAIVAVMALPVALGGLTTASDRLRPGRALLAYGIASALLLVGVLVTGSRAGLIGAMLGVILIVAVPVRGSRTGVRVSLIALVILATIALAGTSGTNDLFVGQARLLNPGTGEAASNSARDTGFTSALADFASDPLFGAGFSNVHGALNIFLQLLQSGGVLAFGAFAAFTVGTLRTGRRLARDRVASLPDRQLALSLVISVVCWLVYSLFQNAIYDRFLYVPAGLILAMYLARDQPANVVNATAKES